MDIYEISGSGNEESFGFTIISEVRDELKFMNPDRVQNPSSDARLLAAKRWPGLQVVAERGSNRGVKPYFYDAIGAGTGFSFDSCDMAVSEHAKEVLAPILGDQVC